MIGGLAEYTTCFYIIAELAGSRRETASVILFGIGSGDRMVGGRSGARAGSGCRW